MAQHNIRVPRGIAATTPVSANNGEKKKKKKKKKKKTQSKLFQALARKAADELGGSRVVVKAQILAGGRGMIFNAQIASGADVARGF
jgi:hypothetical protein